MQSYQRYKTEADTVAALRDAATDDETRTKLDEVWAELITAARHETYAARFQQKAADDRQLAAQHRVVTAIQTGTRMGVAAPPTMTEYDERAIRSMAAAEAHRAAALAGIKRGEELRQAMGHPTPTAAPAAPASRRAAK